MEKIKRMNRFIWAGVLIALMILLNCNGPDWVWGCLVVIMAVNVIVSFVLAGKEKSLKGGNS